jgi:hypothetical protein
MKKLLMFLMLFVSITSYSQTEITTLGDTTVTVKPKCPCQKNKKVKKSGKKRSEFGKVLWVIVDIFEEVLPLFKYFK